ncbi:unnamed protein product [Closterium sp. NIES-64]|nr:unnamed protein product [Closterium sp. NIES-64]
MLVTPTTPNPPKPPSSPLSQPSGSAAQDPKLMEMPCCCQVAAQDPELMELFGDAMLDPQQMQEKMEERIRSKQAELLAEKRGSGATMQVAIKEIDPFDMYIWFELHKTPSEDDMNTLGSVIRAWYVVGKLGGYNSANLQLMQGDESSKYKYDVGTAASALPALMHNVGDLEFQDNLGRIWLDIGTANTLSLTRRERVDVDILSLFSSCSEVYFEARHLE